ncbi:MAG: WbqC family protein [Bacteroidales bacterium]|nr:WbqC family protein [Bacteroidales bacterium]
MPKVCAIHQPNFMPWLGYFYKIAKSDVFVILDTVDIEVGTANAITNRTRIKTVAGVQWITVPIKKGDSKVIKDIVIDNTKRWRETMLKTLLFQYKKSQNFNIFYPFVEDLLNYQTDSLSEYNVHIIECMANYMGIKTKIVLASEMKGLSDDRNVRLIDICKQNGCDIYLSGNGGRKYHDEQLFENNGIMVKYTDFIHPEYGQLHGDFEKGLSCIDYCFNDGTELWK